MAVPVDALERAITRRDWRPAVFDIALREQTGQWRLERTVPLHEAIDRFRDREAFLDDDRRLHLPLHEPDGPALTDEYLLVSLETEPITVGFYNLSSRAVESLSLDEAERAFPAWRARYWTSAYSPERSPSFVAEFGGEDPVETAFEPVTPEVAEPPSQSIIETTRSALAARRTVERRRRRRAFSRLPLADFLDDHGGVRNAVTAGRETDDFGQQAARIELPADHTLAGEPDLVRASGIAPGDVVVIDTDETAGFPVEAEVFAIEDDRIELGVYWDTADEPGAEAAFADDVSTTVSLGSLIDGRRYTAIDAALGTVERTDHARARFAGEAELTFAEASVLPETDVELNRDQRHAVARILAAEGIALVHTPPGTGARRVLWSVIRETVEDGGRVCVFAPDENALDRLFERAGEPSLSERAAQAGMSLHRCDSDHPPPVGADVVVATLSLATLVDDHDFDLAVLDQAARVSVPAGAIPFAKAGRVLLLGDPMQSPPDPIRGDLDTDIASSIYQHVIDTYGTDVVSTLRCQYRMNQAIALFPNREFYDDSLIHGQKNREWTIETTTPIEGYQIPGEEIQTPTGSAFNDAAVDATVAEIDRLVDLGVAPSHIGVLTPSSAEMGKMRAAIQKHEGTNSDAITVGGLDRFRCTARDVLIVSFVQSGDEVAPFWSEPGLAVSLTSARRRLVLIGDWEGIADRGESDVAGRLAGFLADRGLVTAPP